MLRLIITFYIILNVKLYLCDDTIITTTTAEHDNNVEMNDDGINLVTLSAKNVFSGDMKARLRMQCFEENGNYDNVQDIESALDELAPRFIEALNITTINKYFYKSNSELNDFFVNFCKNHEAILQASGDFFDITSPCQNETTNNHYKNIHNVTSKYISIVCADDASKITEFINDDGIECINQSYNNIGQCVKEKLTKYEDLSYEEIQNEMYSCDMFNNIRQCSVQHLKNCKKLTASNFVEFTFAQIEKELPCKNGYISEDLKFIVSLTLAH